MRATTTKSQINSLGNDVCPVPSAQCPVSRLDEFRSSVLLMLRVFVLVPPMDLDLCPFLFRDLYLSDTVTIHIKQQRKVFCNNARKFSAFHMRKGLPAINPCIIQQLNLVRKICHLHMKKRQLG